MNKMRKLERTWSLPEWDDVKCKNWRKGGHLYEFVGEEGVAFVLWEAEDGGVDWTKEGYMRLEYLVSKLYYVSLMRCSFFLSVPLPINPCHTLHLFSAHHIFFSFSTFLQPSCPLSSGPSPYLNIILFFSLASCVTSMHMHHATIALSIAPSPPQQFVFS